MGEAERPARLPATYHRTHGVRYFHDCYCLGDDQLWGVMRARKGRERARIRCERHHRWGRPRPKAA